MKTHFNYVVIQIKQLISDVCASVVLSMLQVTAIASFFGRCKFSKLERCNCSSTTRN